MSRVMGASWAIDRCPTAIPVPGGLAMDPGQATRNSLTSSRAHGKVWPSADLIDPSIPTGGLAHRIDALSDRIAGGARARLRGGATQRRYPPARSRRDFNRPRRDGGVADCRSRTVAPALHDPHL